MCGMPFASRMSMPGCCMPLSRVMRPIGRSCAETEKAVRRIARPKDRIIDASLRGTVIRLSKPNFEFRISNEELGKAGGLLHSQFFIRNSKFIAPQSRSGIESPPQGVRMRSPVVPVVVLALIAVPLFGQSNDVAVWIGSSRVGTTSTGGSDIHFDRGNAFGVSLNHFFSNHYSAEV